MTAFATGTELASHLQRDLDLASANLALAGASGAIRAHCGWGVSWELGATFEVAGSGTVVLCLPTLNLTAVDEVRVDGEVVDPTTYRWARRGQLYCATGWPAWTSVEVDCDHGYAPIPDVVRLVALGLAARIYTNPDNVKVAAVGSVSREYDITMTELDLRLLDPYRI